MEFENKMFNWENEGAEPSDELKKNGFKQGYKPSAGVFNRFWHLVTKAITELQNKHGFSRVVDATSTDGITYTATVEGITELYEGLEITIRPNISNTSNAMTLDINGLGAKPIRRPLSFSTYVANSAKEGFLHQNAPCRLMYHAEYPNRVNDVSGKGIWLMADKVEVSAQDLYGKVPIESGGTGASTAAEALANLGLKVDDDSFVTVSTPNNCEEGLYLVRYIRGNTEIIGFYYHSQSQYYQSDVYTKVIASISEPKDSEDLALAYKSIVLYFDIMNDKFRLTKYKTDGTYEIENVTVTMKRLF